MKTTTIIYVGPKTQFNLTKPQLMSFPQHVPITINSLLLDHLPAEDFEIYDPQKHNLKDSKNYTSWDIKAVKKSDIILGYIEKDNVSGYGLCVEIGYGKALGKTIIWVEEDRKSERNKYFGMCRELADYIFYDIILFCLYF